MKDLRGSWARRRLLAVISTLAVLLATLLTSPRVAGASALDLPDLPGNSAHADSIIVVLNVPYATVTDVNGQPFDLPLDVYIPPASFGAGPFPSVLIVHGAPLTGDKRKFGGQAMAFAQDGFVAFVANYRMPCHPNKPPPGVDPRLCGFHAPVPTDDLQLAMHWIRKDAATYEGNPAEVGAHGASFGGNLAAYLGVTAIPGDTRPDAVTSWSGLMEFWLYYQSPKPEAVYTATRAYTGVPCVQAVTPPACPDSWHTYSAASPGQTQNPVLPSDAAPMYLANSRQEKTPLQVAEDMCSELQIAHGSGIDQLSVLDGTKHAAQYQNDIDPATGLTILAETLAFQHAYLG